VIKFLLLNAFTSSGIILNPFFNNLIKTTANQIIKFDLKQTTIVTNVKGDLSSEISFNILPKNIYIPNNFNGCIPIINTVEYLKNGYDTNTSGC